VAGRPLQPKRIKEHQITSVRISDPRAVKILQIGEVEKVIEGEVELYHVSLTNERYHPMIKFNEVYVGDLDISQYSHPMRKEFWYGDYNRNRAPFAEMLRECHARKIRIIFPGLLHFVPEPLGHEAPRFMFTHKDDSKSPPVGIVTVYCDLPTAAEVKREYPEFRL
jgi:hypothetical protein